MPRIGLPHRLVITKNMLSQLFRLNLTDLLKGLVVAVLAAVLAAIQKMLSDNGLNFSAQDGQFILNVALSSGVAYLVKNFVTDENNKLGGMF